MMVRLNLLLGGALVFALVLGVPSVTAEVSLGSVYECAHAFRGQVFVKNEREITIKGFSYDGAGPAAWFHGQLKGSEGVYTSDPDKFITLPYPDGTCDRLKPGKSYSNEEISLILPVSIKQFKTIGIFCYQYCHNFGHIVIPDDLVVPAAPAGLQETNKCPVPNYPTCTLEATKSRSGKIEPNCPRSGSSSALSAKGKSIGPMYQCAHGLRGEVFVKNEREIVIKGFNYDGKGPAAWFHGQLKGSKGVATSSDSRFMTLPYPNGNCDRLKPGKSYKDEDITLILPVSIKEFETIGIYCYEYCHNFGHIIVPKDLDVPAAPMDLLQTSECRKPDYKKCTIDQGKNTAIKPDCIAGAPQLIPSSLIIVGILAVILAHQN